MGRSRNRKRHFTTKNTHDGRSNRKTNNFMETINIFDINDLSKYTKEWEDNVNDGPSFGIILNVKTNHYGNFMNFSMMKMDVAKSIASKNILEEYDYDDSKFFGECIMTEYEQRGKISDEAHRGMLGVAIQSYINHVKSHLDTIYNLYITFNVDIKYEKDTFQVHINAERINSFMAFKDKIQELSGLETTNKVPDNSYTEVEVVKSDDTIIKITDDMPRPISGIEYKVLLSIKNSMSILELGKQFMLPNESKFKYAVRTLNKQFFSDKKFSIYECSEQIMIVRK